VSGDIPKPDVEKNKDNDKEGKNFDEKDTDDDSSISDDSEINTDTDIMTRRKAASDRLRQHARYYEVMEKRIKYLENAVNVLENKGILMDLEPPKSTRHLPAIPELKMVNWSQYIELALRPEAPEKYSAIEILTGTPMRWNNLEPSGLRQVAGLNTQEDGAIESVPLSSKVKNSAETTEKPATRPLSKPTLKDLPDRIRVKSIPIIRLLEEITGRIISPADRPLVILRPFKILLLYEEDIKKKIKILEEKWKADESPELENKASADGDKDKKNALNDDDTESERTWGDSREAADDLRVLVEFMDNTVKIALEDLSSPNLRRIAFQDLWYFFRPGDEVYIEK
jgi:hypothetical protein